MKLVVIESPLAGDLKRNQRYARLCLLDCFRRGEAGFAGHLLFTQVLDDKNSAARELGIKAHVAWGSVADVCAVYTDIGISDGMQIGIDAHPEAEEKGALEYRKLPPNLMALLDTDTPLPETEGATDA